MAAVGLWTMGGVLLVLVVSGAGGLDAPRIQSGGTFALGTSKTILCWSLVGESQASSLTLQWSKGTSGLAGVINSTTTTAITTKRNYLTFTVAASDHNQVYTCTATMGGETTSSTVTIYVYNYPNSPVISGPTSVRAGNSYSWTCVVDGASQESPTISWKYANGTSYSSDLYDRHEATYNNTDTGLEAYNVTSTLTVDIADGASDFTLKCIGTQSNTQQSPSSLYDVQVAYLPEVTVQSSPVNAVVNTNINLQCTVTATPAATSVTWYKDGVALSIDSNSRLSGSVASTPSLTITGVVKADAGNYICSATNSVGSVNSSVVTLVVRYIPSISYSQNPVGGELGDDVEVSCLIDAVPTYTTVSWYRISGTGVATSISSTSTPEKYSGGTVSSTPNITIKALTSSDAGLYRCDAQNAEGLGEGDTVEVEVYYDPATPTVTYDSGGYDEGDAITLTCNSTGNPAPQYRWYSGSDVLLGNGSTLSYSSATPERAGNYRCEAYNVAGSASTTVTVVVDYKPRAGDISNVTSSIGNTVTLDCVTLANPAPTSYSWTKAGVTLTSSSTTSTLSVTISDDGDFGRYDCQATNRKGTSDPIYIYLLDNGSTGQSTDDTSLSTATLILIIIVCVIIFIVIILILIYCCASGRCRCLKKDNDVSPSVVAQPAPAVVPISDKPPPTVAASTPNGHVVSSSKTVRRANGKGGIHLDTEDKKTALPLSANGTASLGHGLSISVPGITTPRPHHLPPLGQDGVSEETLSAREDKPKKRKRQRRRHQASDAGRKPEDDIEV